MDVEHNKGKGPRASTRLAFSRNQRKHIAQHRKLMAQDEVSEVCRGQVGQGWGTLQEMSIPGQWTAARF